MGSHLREKTNCICCGHDGYFYPLDYEHTKTKGSGGTDDDWNVSVMCRKCHNEKGNKGPTYMANKFPSYKKWLLENSWEFNDFLNKWIRYEK